MGFPVQWHKPKEDIHIVKDNDFLYKTNIQLTSPKCKAKRYIVLPLCLFLLELKNVYIAARTNTGACDSLHNFKNPERVRGETLGYWCNNISYLTAFVLTINLYIYKSRSYKGLSSAFPKVSHLFPGT